MKKFRESKLVRTAKLGIMPILMGLILTSCDLKIKEENIKEVGLNQIIENPSVYEHKRIATKGYPEYIGNENYFIAYPYYDMNLKMQTISLSEVTLTTHRLHTSPDKKSNYFTITEKNRGTYLLVPIVPSFEDKYKNLTKVTGYVEKDKDNKYFLEVSSAEELLPKNKK